MKNPEKRFLYYYASIGQYVEKLPFARELRSNMTEAEKILWSHIRKRQIDGHRFRRQHIIDRYIVDFVCLEKLLIIEVDGEYHNDPQQQAEDEKREAAIKALGFRILRFSNHEVIHNIGTVLDTIRAELSQSDS